MISPSLRVKDALERILEVVVILAITLALVYVGKLSPELAIPLGGALAAVKAIVANYFGDPDTAGFTDTRG